LTLVALCLAASVALQASEAPPAKQIRAVRLQGTSITLDGRLNDPAWAQATWISDFVQKPAARRRAAQRQHAHRDFLR